MTHPAPARRVSDLRDVARCARRDVELPEHIVEPQPLDPRAKPDPDRAFGIVRAHRDHRTFESRIADSGHREQELAGKIGARLHETDHNGWPRARPRLKIGRSFPSYRVPHVSCGRRSEEHTSELQSLIRIT